MASPSSTSHNLKRGCSSLSADNICSACQKVFSTPHYLDRHQKNACASTKVELGELRRRALDLQEAKRRRLEEVCPHPTSGSSRWVSRDNVGALASAVPHAATTGTPEAVVPSDDTHDTTQTLTPGEGCSRETPLDNKHDHGTIPDTSSLKQSDTTRAGTTRVPPDYHSSGPDSFGLKKRYYAKKLPSYDPDSALSSADRYDSKNHFDPGDEDTQEKEDKSEDESTNPRFDPFPNSSSFDLGEWFYGQGNQKSIKDFKALVRILTSPDFSLDDIRKTKWTRIFQDLGKNKEEIDPRRADWVDDSGWKTTDIEIEVPIHNKMAQGRGVERHVAGKLFHRSIVSIVEEKIRNADDSKRFHYNGHELLWKPNGEDSSPEFRIVSELYHSDAFLQAEKDVLDSPPPSVKNCEHPRVVIGLMFWSDATHVSTFSSCKLWPLYMLFANESKYRRAKNGTDLCNHVAYFDALSDSFKDYLTARTGGKIPPHLIAHLNRELAHAQWEVILDDELLRAIVDGILIECSDGILRRFFIRIFTYSTDYPERVLMATIKARGDCPCVLCLVRKKDLNQTGTPQDMAFREANPRLDDDTRREGVLKAREAIRRGLAVGGDSVMCHLSHSGVPTINVFSKRLGSTDFNIFASLAVDILHEFEVGAFKGLFIHLIRILDAFASGSTLVHELDRRYRSVPTFNRTIRKFSSNVSSLKRRAARDYEDVLQCSMAVFDGLLTGSMNDLVLKLLFLNARWHALAKLRMHSEATIILLEQVTTQLGDQYRKFIKDTSKVNTLERPREAEKRTKAASKKKQGNESDSPQDPQPSQAVSHIPGQASAPTGSHTTVPTPDLGCPLPQPIAGIPVHDVHAGQHQYQAYTTAFAVPNPVIYSEAPGHTWPHPTPMVPTHLYPGVHPHHHGSELLHSAHPQAQRETTIQRSGHALQTPYSSFTVRTGALAGQPIQYAPLPPTTNADPHQYLSAHHHIPRCATSGSQPVAFGMAGQNFPNSIANYYHTAGGHVRVANSMDPRYWQAYYQAEAPSSLLPPNPAGGFPLHSVPSQNLVLQPSLLALDPSSSTPSSGTSQTSPRPSAAQGSHSMVPAPESQLTAAQSSSNPPSAPDQSTVSGKTGSTGRKSKKLNIHTVKFHVLGHYPQVIRRFGPTDLYSTEWGEYFHKFPKAWTKQTSRKQLRMELSRHERRRKRIQRAKYRVLSTGQSAKAQDFREQRMASRNPDIHHFIGMSKRVFVVLSDFSQGGRFCNDVLSLMFIRNLKQYLLPRFISLTMPQLSSTAASSFVRTQDWSRLVLRKDRIYCQQMMRIKYTTYDTRRDEDIIHLDTSQCSVMLLNPTYSRVSRSTEHPFRYAKVMAILHADVGYIGDAGRSGSQFAYHRMELLWVRWYRVHPAVSEFDLDQAELMQPDEPGSHSFIDPLQVLRACHIIPRFCDGKKYTDGKGQSLLAQDASDWRRYYINRFVDRDMFMRYEWGLAPGHVYTHSDSVSAIEKILSSNSDASNQGGSRMGSGRTQGEGATVAPVTIESPVNDPHNGTAPASTGEEGTPDAALSNVGHALTEGSGEFPTVSTEGEEDDEHGDDDGSVSTDASSCRGYSDSEDEREAVLLGLDF